MKCIVVVDWVLIPVFLLFFISGIALHASGHGGHHESRPSWVVVHLVAGLLFAIVGSFHLYMHRNWYKARLKPDGMKRRHGETAIFSCLFLLAVITGLVLLDGRGGRIGLGHCQVGLVTAFFSLLHVFRRVSILRKSLGR